MKAKKKHFDVHEHVTGQIIKAIEDGPQEVQMPWQRLGINSLPTNAHTNAEYQGINILSLWVAAMDSDFSNNIWATYAQWKKVDSQVRRGEKASCVIFYKEFETEPDAEDPEDKGLRRFARASWVFNASQVDGYELPEIPDRPLISRISEAEDLIGSTGANIRHGGDRAFYRPSEDIIQMPDERLFEGKTPAARTENYYAILLHELTHWTSPKHRLDRQLGKRFGDDTYAMEELIAELGAAFLCADIGISIEPRQDHAAYIANWLQILKEDNRAIFAAAAQSSKAVNFIKQQTRSASGRAISQNIATRPDEKPATEPERNRQNIELCRENTLSSIEQLQELANACSELQAGLETISGGQLSMIMIKGKRALIDKLFELNKKAPQLACDQFNWRTKDFAELATPASIQRNWNAQCAALVVKHWAGSRLPKKLPTPSRRLAIITKLLAQAHKETERLLAMEKTGIDSPAQKQYFLVSEYLHEAADFISLMVAHHSDQADNYYSTRPNPYELTDWQEKRLNMSKAGTAKKPAEKKKGQLDLFD